MNLPTVISVAAATAGALLACSAATTRAGHHLATQHASWSRRPVPAAATGGLRPLPGPLYGVTVDNIANLRAIVASSKHLTHMPTTRIYFDVKHEARYYLHAVTRLHPVSYLMGELLDSSDERKISVSAFGTRVESYVRTLGPDIDLWEIGNEVNGDWTGRYAAVSAKLTEAYQDVAANGYRSALTLYYDIGCGDGHKELHPLAFSRRYVPQKVRDGLDYVLLSYYEDDCKNIRPSDASWTSFFKKLHVLYPNARVGFGEIGMNNPATRKTRAAAKSLIRHYYGLRIKLQYYIGGYFWWYYDEDCLPYTAKPLWRVLNAGFEREASAIGPAAVP
jgi:hypothetical protein